MNSRPTRLVCLLTALRLPTIRLVRSTPVEPEPPSATAAVLATVAAALETGAVLLDDDEVLLANEAALALRVVYGRELTSRMLSRIAREARRTGPAHRPGHRSAVGLVVSGSPRGRGTRAWHRPGGALAERPPGVTPP